MVGKNVRKVAHWEFHKALRSPVFLVMTLVIPLIMAASGGASYLLQHRTAQQPVRVVVWAEPVELYDRLLTEVPASSVTFTRIETGREQAEAAVLAGEYDGLIILNQPSLLAGHIGYLVRDVRTTTDAPLRQALTPWLTAYRLQELGLGLQQIQAAMTPVRISTQALSGETTDPFSVFAPLIAAVILVMSTILSGQILMYGVIKEKRNRIVEILLSSISSRELMLGKVLGYGLLSLLQVLLWVGAGLLIASRFIDVGRFLGNPAALGSSLVFFLLGYFFLASFFAAVGATMKDAESGSQAQGLVIMIPMIPLFFAGLLMATPQAPWVRLLSHSPPFIPVTMLMRLGISSVPWWELGTSLLALIVSIGVMLRLGARIFEGGILQYDRSLNFRDLGRLLRVR